MDKRAEGWPVTTSAELDTEYIALDWRKAFHKISQQMRAYKQIISNHLQKPEYKKELTLWCCLVWREKPSGPRQCPRHASETEEK